MSGCERMVGCGVNWVGGLSGRVYVLWWVMIWCDDVVVVVVVVYVCVCVCACVCVWWW
jgi:hypothetical protein